MKHHRSKLVKHKKKNCQITLKPAQTIALGAVALIGMGAAISLADNYSNSDTPDSNSTPTSNSTTSTNSTSNSKQTTMPEVDVTADQEKNNNSYVAHDVSLTKYTQPLLDTPQSITVVSQQLMQDQNVSSLRDALRDVPGVSISAGEGAQQGDTLTLRGFNARNDLYLDGMLDTGSYYRDSFDYDRVEALEGPSGIAFGRGSTGGVINQVSKTPENYPEISGEVGVGTDQRNRETVDINEPIKNSPVPGTAVRLNLMNEETNVTDRDDVDFKHFGVAPSIALGLGTPTRITLSYLHEQEYDRPDYGIPWLFNGPAPVDRNNYYGFSNDFLNTDVNIMTARVEHDVNDNITVDDQLRYGTYNIDFLATEPKIVGTPTLSTPLSSILVTPNMLNLDQQNSTLDNQFDVTSKFNTGFLKHTLVTGFEDGRQTSQSTKRTYSGLPTESLLDPNLYYQPFTYTSDPISSQVYATVDDFGYYGLDTIDINDYWQVMTGYRWDQVDSRYKQEIAPSSAFSRTDRIPSYREALVYKPTENGSIYFDYGTSFDPSAESVSLSASTANVAPEKSNTYELGTKWDLLNKKIQVHSAIFRTNMTNVREPDPNGGVSNVLAGDQLVQGIELEGAGHITKEWQVDLGYEYLKSREEKSKDYPTAVGAELYNVPANTVNFWTTYDLPWKVTVGGGGNFVDSRTASSTAPIDPTTGLVKEVPSYWVFNAMLEYHVNKNVDIQLNLYNLANKYYIDQVHPGHLIPGEGRTAILSTKFKF